jgi:putative transposase
MQRKIKLAEGEYYHLYNRGVDKRKIFLDDYDCRRFIKLLYVANGNERFVYRDIEKKPINEITRGSPLVAIGAYVLMPNHFHILIKEIRRDGTSQFMEKLLTGYASYFNKRHGRVGRLFQGNFQAKHANKDEYLKYLFSYIHLNPIKLIEPTWKERTIQDVKGAEQFLNSFKYSSYLDYCGNAREENSLLSIDAFPDYFSNKYTFKNLTKEWLIHKNADTPIT